MPRLNSRRPGFLLIGSIATAWNRGGNSSRRPASFHSAGRTKRWKVSIDATGLPGRPKNSAGPMRPTASGRPGCIATCQNSMPPASCSTALTRSWSPTETPPEVSTTSAVAAAARRRACSTS